MNPSAALHAIREIKQKLSDAKEAIERIQREVHFLYVELSQQELRSPSDSPIIPINNPSHEGRE